MRRQGLRGAAVVALAAALAWAAGAKNSATADEPYHVLAGWSYVVEGKADLNPEHPPLAKLMSGAGAALLGLRGTEHPAVERLHHLPEETRRFLYENARPSRVILAAARAPLALFLVALLWVVHVWATRLWGEPGGFLALLSLASQPLLLGHAPIVHTDVAAAATSTLTLWALHRWLRGARHGWLPAGVLLGLALLSKFSMLALVPIGALLVVIGSRRAELVPRLLRFLGSCAIAGAVVFAGYLPELRNTTAAEERATIETLTARWPGASAASARLVSLSRVCPPLAHYGLGLLYVYETDRHGQGVNFFLGKTTREGSPLYFPVALLVKLTLPLLAVLVAAAALKGRTWTRDDAFLLLPAALFVVPALATRYNIGARHVLPVVPLLALFAGQLAGWLSRPARAAALAALAVPPFLAFPHYISHFGLLAGGAKNGAHLLNDSNLDWGQDWRRLADRARAEAWRPLAYVYIGAAYPGADLPGARDWVNDPAPPGPGFYAVSSCAEAVGPDALADAGVPARGDLLRRLVALLHERGRVAARVGTSITVYELR